MEWITVQRDALRNSLGRADDGQISHGLNLVLKLQNPATMPILLGKIRQKQRKIDAGLNELNFVHYARFLPTHDDSALQVITEFDGPLAPYVLDFAIEIGDIFDMLLAYTEGTQKIVPVRDHPAEFLAFVEKHNTITVFPNQQFPDWPLYAADPDSTVLDEVGPRKDLPIPKPDRWATPVDRNDIQGNILQGFRAERVRHYVLQVLEARKARRWLANKAAPDKANAAGLPAVTSFTPWQQRPALMVNVGLTSIGMQALGIRQAWLDAFPEAFRQGALLRATDNFDVGTNAPDHWWLGGPDQAPDIHIVASLYQNPGGQQEFDKAHQALVASLSAGGLRLLAAHDAAYRHGESWFGYADGIAEPRIATRCPDRDADPPDLQPATTPGEFVLGAGHRNIYGGNALGDMPKALATNGSFCAIRVLAQDVDLFKSTLDKEAKRLGQKADWLAAKLMGRWYGGAPLTLYPTEEPPAAAGVVLKKAGEGARNDFDYAPSYEYPGNQMDHEGHLCPVGAHIRRANPRGARVAGARYTRRLMRRGMHYEITNSKGEREVGLFGLFLCADLERQFEFIQRQWINGDRFAAGVRGTRDPFVGTPDNDKQVFRIPMPSASDMELELPQFVHTKGSVYLFMPGLNALRNLEQFAAEDPPKLVAPAAPSATGDPGLISALPDPKWLAGVAKLVSEEELRAIAEASVGLNARGAGRTRSSASLQNLRFDPRKRSFQVNPYPVYAQFRAEEPVHYSPLFQGWFVFGYDDVVKVCTDDAAFSAAAIGSKDPRGLFTLDEPQHGDVRHRIAQSWNEAAKQADTFVASSIQRTLDAIVDDPCFDLVDDFARPVPRDVYFDILGGKGIGSAERLKLDALARTVMKYHDHTLTDLQSLDGILAGAELAARLGSMAVEAQINPAFKGSFIQRLAGVMGGALTPVAALMTLVNLTVAGYMSVEFLLATGIRRLLVDDGKGWEALREDPSQLPWFLKEMRRYEHALSVVDRFAKTDVSMGGRRIPQGTRVFGVLASANRDEKIFGPDADTFDPKRCPPREHLGLGWGTHTCMGRDLENRISGPAIAALLTERSALRLQSPAQPSWFENFYFRSFDHLTVTEI